MRLSRLWVALASAGFLGRQIEEAKASVTRELIPYFDRMYNEQKETNKLLKEILEATKRH